MRIHELKSLVSTVKAAGATFVVLLTMATGIWYWAKSHYQSQLESYRAQVEGLDLAFSEAASVFDKTVNLAAELREPQLWRVDTVYFKEDGHGILGASNPLHMYGGLLTFTFKVYRREDHRVEGTFSNYVSGIPYHVDGSPIETITEQPLLLLYISKERFEFSAGEQSYYLYLSPTDSTQSALAVYIYKLNPLYIPAE